MPAPESVVGRASSLPGERELRVLAPISVAGDQPCDEGAVAGDGALARGQESRTGAPRMRLLWLTEPAVTVHMVSGTK